VPRRANINSVTNLYVFQSVCESQHITLKRTDLRSERYLAPVANGGFWTRPVCWPGLPRPASVTEGAARSRPFHAVSHVPKGS
jgi:hypothetical protein